MNAVIARYAILMDVVYQVSYLACKTKLLMLIVECGFKFATREMFIVTFQNVSIIKHIVTVLSII